MNDFALALLFLLSLPVAALACGQAVEIWHHSALLAGWRARVELWEGWLGQLLGCPFCLSPWVSLLLCLELAAGLGGLASGWRWCGLGLLLPVAALAVARAANLLNDLTRPFCRTPRHDRLAAPAEAGGAEDGPSGFAGTDA